ncbi:hypothetical protein [Microbacterium sp. XT11]|uniref:hypothetical protein n=1 Tax=Microbacterium sp. XT11 TaxID=367477 RepID=UPI000835B54E|nr:hypothetical protein [Microbacterium sp. XT11]
MSSDALCPACTKTAEALGHTAEERLAALGWSPTGFQMQSYHDGVWTPMENGNASKHWAPKKSRYEAVHMCIAWTGGVCIPAMRVVDLSTGKVIWQDRWDGGNAADLDQIIPEWARAIYGQVRAEQRESQAVLDHAVDEYVPDRKTAPADDCALFSLAEMDS